MFGDKLLAGQYEATVDGKNRIILPSRTKREKDDTVIVIYDEASDYYKFYSEQAVEKMFEIYKTAIINSKTEEEKLFHEKEQLKFCNMVLKSCHVDSQGRIALTGVVESGENIKLIGCGDHLILKRTKNK